MCRVRAGAADGRRLSPKPTSLRVWADFPQLSFLRHRPEQIAWQTAAHPARARRGAAGGGASAVGARQHRAVRLHARSRRPVRHRHRGAGPAALVGDGGAHPQFADRAWRWIPSCCWMRTAQQPASAARAEELQQRLQRALAQSAGVQPSKRGMSRHQKHFPDDAEDQLPRRRRPHPAGAGRYRSPRAAGRGGASHAGTPKYVCTTHDRDLRRACRGFFPAHLSANAPLGAAQQELPVAGVAVADRTGEGLIELQIGYARLRQPDVMIHSRSSPAISSRPLRAAVPTCRLAMTPYLLIKTLHLLFVIAWMATVFYLPRILVNLAESGERAGGAGATAVDGAAAVQVRPQHVRPRLPVRADPVAGLAGVSASVAERHRWRCTGSTPS